MVVAVLMKFNVVASSESERVAGRWMDAAEMPGQRSIASRGCSVVVTWNVSWRKLIKVPAQGVERLDRSRNQVGPRDALDCLPVSCCSSKKNVLIESDANHNMGWARKASRMERKREKDGVWVGRLLSADSFCAMDFLAWAP